MVLTPISVVIIAKDAATYIATCLDSTQSFDDVVLYLNNCTDNTADIAKTYNNVNIIEGYFDGFGSTKNRAASYAKHHWILSLDADEVLPKDIAQTSTKISDDDYKVYTLLRSNYYKNMQITHCWKIETLVRIYNKRTTGFTDSKVHEKIITENFQIENINSTIKHNPYSTISDFIIKIDRYSSLFSADKVGKQNSSPLKAFSNATYTFFKTYLFKRGFLDGYPGLIISVTHATNNFYKYMKLYEANKNLK